MKKAETKDRIKEALELREMKQSELVEKTGIDKGQMSSYLAGRYKPKQQNLNLIAEALGVDEAWLMGYDVPMEREGSRITHFDTKHQEAYNIDDTNLICLINNYKELSIDYRNRLVSYSQKLLDLYKDEEMLKDEPISEILKNVPKTPEELEQKYPPVDVEGLRTKKNIG